MATFAYRGFERRMSGITSMRPSLLFISQQLPFPLTDGGNVRTYKILEALASRYEITLIGSLRKEGDRQEALGAMSRLCKEIVCVPDVKSTSLVYSVGVIARGLRTGLPFSIAYNFNPHVLEAVTDKLVSARFDFVHLNHLDAVQHLPPGLSGFRKVLDTHNLLFELYEKAARFESSALKRRFKAMEAQRLCHYERRAFAQMDGLLVCSQREAELAAGWGLVNHMQVVPNGVDCDYFAPPSTSYAVNPPVLVFTGAMGYEPNADAALHFIRHTLPILRQRVLGIRFVVVGKNPTEELVSESRKHTDVTVTGMVPDVREYVYRSRIFVVPIRMGAGTRLKVLEAFALGIPAVSTPVGAEGIDYEEERHLLVAESPAEMADAVCRLLDDTELYHSLAKESRALALSRYDWKAVGKGLLEGYEDRGRRA